MNYLRMIFRLELAKGCLALFEQEARKNNFLIQMKYRENLSRAVCDKTHFLYGS